MKKAKKCVFLHVRGELAKNSTQTKKWEKRCVICSQAGQRAGVRGVKKSKKSIEIKEKLQIEPPPHLFLQSENCKSNPPLRNAFFSTDEENSQRITRKRRNGTNFVSYVPKLDKEPELGGSRNRRNPLFFTFEENSLRIPRKRRNRRNVESYVPKLAQGPEVGIRLGVLSFQYKHW